MFEELKDTVTKRISGCSEDFLRADAFAASILAVVTIHARSKQQRPDLNRRHPRGRRV
jgi:hypothetical protein